MARSNLRIALAANNAARYGKIGRYIAFILKQANRVLFCCDISIGARIDPSVSFYHSGLGCAIHADAVIGANCTIMQNVTVGSTWSGGGAPGKGTPVIGKNVFLGAGCVVIGDISIGDGSVIGANAVVTKSIPPNSVAVGVPARVIKTLTS